MSGMVNMSPFMRIMYRAQNVKILNKMRIFFRNFEGTFWLKCERVRIFDIDKQILIFLNLVFTQSQHMTLKLFKAHLYTISLPRFSLYFF